MGMQQDGENGLKGENRQESIDRVPVRCNLQRLIVTAVFEYLQESFTSECLGIYFCALANRCDLWQSLRPSPQLSQNAAWVDGAAKCFWRPNTGSVSAACLGRLLCRYLGVKGGVGLRFMDAALL